MARQEPAWRQYSGLPYSSCHMFQQPLAHKPSQVPGTLGSVICFIKIEKIIILKKHVCEGITRGRKAIKL